MKKIIIITSVLIFIAIIIVSVYYSSNNKKLSVLSVGVNTESIFVISPIKDSKISSPLSVSGKAKSSWFTYGNFLLLLNDENNNTLAEGHASIQGEASKDDFSKFLGNMEFNKPMSGKNGLLILKNEVDSYQVPVIFK